MSDKFGLDIPGIPSPDEAFKNVIGATNLYSTKASNVVQKVNEIDTGFLAAFESSRAKIDQSANVAMQASENLQTSAGIPSNIANIIGLFDPTYSRSKNTAALSAASTAISIEKSRMDTLKQARDIQVGLATNEAEQAKIQAQTAGQVFNLVKAEEQFRLSKAQTLQSMSIASARFKQQTTEHNWTMSMQKLGAMSPEATAEIAKDPKHPLAGAAWERLKRLEQLEMQGDAAKLALATGKMEKAAKQKNLMLETFHESDLLSLREQMQKSGIAEIEYGDTKVRFSQKEIETALAERRDLLDRTAKQDTERLAVAAEVGPKNEQVKSLGEGLAAANNGVIPINLMGEIQTANARYAAAEKAGDVAALKKAADDRVTAVTKATDDLVKSLPTVQQGPIKNYIQAGGKWTDAPNAQQYFVSALPSLDISLNDNPYLASAATQAKNIAMTALTTNSIDLKGFDKKGGNSFDLPVELTKNNMVPKVQQALDANPQWKNSIKQMVSMDYAIGTLIELAKQTPALQGIFIADPLNPERRVLPNKYYGQTPDGKRGALDLGNVLADIAQLDAKQPGQNLLDGALASLKDPERMKKFLDANVYARSNNPAASALLFMAFGRTGLEREVHNFVQQDIIVKTPQYIQTGQQRNEMNMSHIRMGEGIARTIGTAGGKMLENNTSPNSIIGQVQKLIQSSAPPTASANLPAAPNYEINPLGAP